MTDTISFYYGCEERRIDFGNNLEFRATDTLLYYLRKIAGEKATREGCGVGDCGACTVVVGELREGRIVYYPINSCLTLLPSLQGKWLITSKHLSDGDVLHPVQEKLLKYYGVQCGFCTSGMLMSMFAMYKNTTNPNRETVEERLTGNLCRCTGYRSILEATMEACDGGSDKFTDMEHVVVKWMERNMPTEFLYRRDEILYYRPDELAKALIWYHRESHCSPTCGSSDLVVMHQKQGKRITHILDVSAVKELRSIEIEDNGIVIGAAVTIDRVREAVRELFPEIYALLGKFASYQIRQVASLAGNIASPSPIGDTIPMLMAHEAVVRIARVENGEVVKREVGMSDFVIGYKKSALEHDELIHSIFIPMVPQGVVVRCFKVSKRRSVDIASVSLSVRLVLKNNEIEDVKLYYGGMAEMVKRAKNAEEELKGKRLDEESLAVAKVALTKDFTPISDARATAQRRMELAQGLLEMLVY